MRDRLLQRDAAQPRALGGVYAFGLIWFGQLISLIGSGLTSFALGVWVYESTGSVTAYALIVLFAMAPSILLSPLAGALVDRWNRRVAMIVSDTGAGLSTLAIVLLLASGRYQLWQIYLATAFNSAFAAIQWPAFAAAIISLVPQEHLGRANGLSQLSQAIGYIVPPALAGLLVTRIEISGVVLLDFLTFAFSVLTLMVVRVPRPPSSTSRAQGPGALLAEVVYGWSYLVARPGLMGLLVLFALINFLLGLVMALFTPMMLSFAGADVVGAVTSIGASGMLFGAALTSVWGGPRRRVVGLLGCMFLTGVALLTGGLRPSVHLVGLAAFVFFFSFAIAGVSSDTIWQRKVAADVQGRVFATRSAVATSSMPLAYLVAGPLADRVFEPLLAVGGPLVDSLGWLIGVGAGRGIGLMFVLTGLLTMGAAAVGYAYPRIRRLEDELPDANPPESPVAADNGQP